MKTIFTALVAAGLMTACIQETADPAQASKAVRGTPTSKPSKAVTAATKKSAAVDRLDPEVYDHFGEGIAKGAEPVTLATVATALDEHAGKKVCLTGKVTAVCKKKGCWMVLTDGPTKVRIKFRDYGFFMPLDCEGREAILDGDLAVKEVSVAEIKHLLEDEGKHDEAKKVDKPRHELTVMADGVALKK